MSKIRLNSFACTLYLLLFVTITPASSQYAEVRKISAQTADGLVLIVWVEPQSVIFGEEIVIHYRAENRGSKTIYLVHENPPDIMAETDTIIIGEPLPMPIEHGKYNFNFTKIDRGRSYLGTLSVPRTIYDKVGPWRIKAGFGYVTDITGLNRQLKPDEAPSVLRGPLNERLKTLQVGSVTVEVTKS